MTTNTNLDTVKLLCSQQKTTHPKALAGGKLEEPTGRRAGPWSRVPSETQRCGVAVRCLRLTLRLPPASHWHLTHVPRSPVTLHETRSRPGRRTFFFLNSGSHVVLASLEFPIWADRVGDCDGYNWTVERRVGEGDRGPPQGQRR